MSPEETFRLPVVGQFATETAYLTEMLRKVDEVLARHSHRTAEVLTATVTCLSLNRKHHEGI